MEFVPCERRAASGAGALFVVGSAPARSRPAAPLLSFYREIYRNEKIDTSFYYFSVKVCIVLILFILPFINYVLFGCSSKYAHSGISFVPVLGRKYLAAKSI